MFDKTCALFALVMLRMCVCTDTATTQEELEQRLSIVPSGPTVNRRNSYYSRTPIFVKTGEKRAFNCESTLPYKHWLDPRGELVTTWRSSTAHTHVELASNGSFTLFLDDPTLRDNGTWTCRAGDRNRTIDIYIIEAVKFVKDHAVTTVEVGVNATLDCAARGRPEPQLLMHKVDPAGTFQLLDQPHKFELNQTTGPGWSALQLSIRDVRESDAGQYECKALQQVGQLFFDTSSTTKLLIVHHKPVVEPTIEDYYIPINSKKLLTCAARALPKPSYKWLRRAPNSWETAIEVGVTHAGDGSRSELRLHLQEDSDFGEYVCQVSNQYGTSRVIYHILRGKTPDPLKKVVLKVANEESLVFEITCGDCPSVPETIKECLCSAHNNSITPTHVDANHLPIIKYRIEAINYTDPSDWDKHHDEAIVEDFDNFENRTAVVTLAGLRPATTYQVRAAAVNLAGLSNYTDLGHHTTAPATVAIPVARLVATLALVACCSRTNGDTVSI